MASIASALSELKASIRDGLGAGLIERACEESNYTWRQRVLGPVETVWMFATQVLHNTSCTHATDLVPDVKATDAAYCQARTRIPLRVFKHLFRLVTDGLLPTTDAAVERWRGHRVFGVDGTSFSMPDTPELDEAFGHPVSQSKGCSFPGANLVALFNLRTGLMVAMAVDRIYTNEFRMARRLLRYLRRDDIVVADRAYASFTMLDLLSQHGVHAVIRQHQSRKVDFRRGRYVGKGDRIIELLKPNKRPKWMSETQFAALPKSITVRTIRYAIKAEGQRTASVTLTTTLCDAELYPAAEIAQLYGDRWEVETCYRHLKQTLHTDVLRCKTEDRVRKELFMHCIVYNLVRAIMVQAGIERGVPPDRISLIAVVRYLNSGKVDLDNLPEFKINPKRPGRHRPRSVKRRPKRFPLLTGPDSEPSRKRIPSQSL